jgi:hypothetical protein
MTDDQNKNSNIKRLREHFGLTAGDDFVWASRANSHKAMKRACGDPNVMLIEADIRRNPLNGELIAAHPPVATSDLDLETSIDMAIAAHKVMKIDKKGPKALIAEIVDIYERKMKEKQEKIPVILNIGNVVQGPGGRKPYLKDSVNALNQARRLEPDVIVSLNWATAETSRPKIYTNAMMDDMIDFISRHVGNMGYTLCFRAADVKTSFDAIKYLTKKLPDAHFTVWGHSNSATASADDLEWMKNHLDPEHVTYDVIGPKKTGLSRAYADVAGFIKAYIPVIKERLRHPGLIFKHGL